MANQRSRGGAQQPPGKPGKNQQAQSRRAPPNRDRNPRPLDDDAHEREMQRRAARDMQDDEDEV